MTRTTCSALLGPFLVALQLVPTGHLRAQVPATASHDHLTEVACVDVPPSEKRPEFGCFNVGVATGLHFSQASVYWHLHAFPSRKAAEAAKSPTGIVVEEDGRVCLSEFSRTRSCGPATIRGCTYTRAPKAGTCSRESSAWRRRMAPTELGREEP